jgi:hypothetical protein
VLSIPAVGAELVKPTQGKIVMNKLLIHAHLETTILDFPLIERNLKCIPALALLLDVKSLYILAYAVAPSRDIGKAVVSALRKGHDASCERSDTSLNYSIDCVLIDGYYRGNAMIKQDAMKFRMNLAYTPPRYSYNGRIEVLVQNLSVALRPHHLGNGCDDSHPIDFATFELELERTITAHNETPARHQLRSPRELLYDQNMACT